ncbi:hypothetical protein C4J96_0152 [Pseudomonas orientalis]|nr:hypothetical protein C4J96_0152 [Pseudomonas orientalis]
MNGSTATPLTGRQRLLPGTKQNVGGGLPPIAVGQLKIY